MSFPRLSEKPKVESTQRVQELAVEHGVDTGPGWRPWTFSSTVLLLAVFFTTGFVILIGLLQWQNFRNGALFMVSTSESFSNVQNFLYRYLPTIVIVLYGVGWSWVDLDIKRLEPWYQLAEKDGAPANQSLLLHYPLDFLPFVPFKAAKRRQWAVLSASTIMVLVVWAVTPLQNGIFNTTVLIRDSNIPVHVSNSLLPLPEQDSILGINILNQAYSAIWLGQALPSFTTMDYALAPFEVSDGVSLAGDNQTMSATTHLYATELNCNSPTNTSADLTSGVTFNDGNGCLAQDLITFPDTEDSQDFVSYYIGYFDDPHSDFSLQLAGCSQSALHESLTIWKRTSQFAPNFTDPSNATALFCTASYYTQRVNATVSLPGRTVVAVTPIGPKQPIVEGIFNITQFEYILANGASPNTALNPASDPSAIRHDVIDTTTLHQDTHVANMSLVVPVPNMIAFAVGTTHFEPQEYLDPAILSMSLQKAYSLLFAIAISSVVQQPGSGPASGGSARATFQAVTLVPVFSILSQIFLLLIAACTCALLYLMQQRVSRLSRDPESLAQIMSLARSESMRQIFSRFDAFSDKQLKDALNPQRFVLSRKENRSRPLIECSTLSSVAPINADGAKSASMSSHTSQSTPKLSHPLEYSIIIRFLVIAYLAGLIISLLILRRKAASEGGLNLPSENAFVQQMVLNFIPTSIATLLEPFLVLVSRLACILQPLEDLRQGKVKARTSLLATYTSVPPQLVVWRALRDRQFLLACLCLLAILANVLTVALSGLFNINGVIHAEASILRSLYQAKFVPVNTTTGDASIVALYNQNDAFYVATSNLSTSTQLPDWTTPDYFFVPLDLSEGSHNVNEGSQWAVRSRGYGADLDCEQLSQAPSNATYDIDFVPNSNLVRIIFTYTNSDGSTFQCKPAAALFNSSGSVSSEADGINGSYNRIGGDGIGRKAFELAQPIVPLNDVGKTSAGPCGNFIVKGWVRTEMQNFINSTSTGANFLQPANVSGGVPNFSGTFISCKPRLKSANFDLLLSPSGLVLSMAQASPATDDVPAQDFEFPLNTTVSNFGGIILPYWHNDTFTSDWPNYLIKLLSGSSDFVDASRDPPDFQKASNLTSAVFSKLFAIQMSLSMSQLVAAEGDSLPISAQLLTSQRRVFVSENLFWIAITILSVDLLVLLVFYWRLPQPFLPRMPNCIASQIAFFAASHVVDDIQKYGGDLEELDGRGFKYGYGKYIGKDGWTHYGIERQPYVIAFDADGKESRSWYTKWTRKRR